MTMNTSQDRITEYDRKPMDYFEQPRSELIDYVPIDAKLILDVGCANGTFGDALKKERDCTVWGIEPVKAAAAVAANRLDVVIQAEFSRELPQIHGKRFDAILFNDVLEHIQDPESVLEVAKTFVRNGGYIIASIPNVLYWPVMYQLLRHGDWEYADSGVLDRTHLRFFTKKSISRMFRDCGYEISVIDGINSIADWRLRILNMISLNHLTNWRFMQFVVRATVRTQ